MVVQWAMDKLWRPSKKLNEARRELQEAQEWLRGCNLKLAPLTPVPTGDLIPLHAPEPLESHRAPKRCHQ